MEDFEVEEIGGAEDKLSASIDYEGRVSVEIEEPWAGDTVSGIGRSGAIRLTREQALALAEWLVQAAASLNKEKQG